jgi:hypothetical protein
MEKLRVYHDREGNTLSLWFDNPFFLSSLQSHNAIGYVVWTVHNGTLDHKSLLM